MILIIDNYDSFTYNIIQCVGSLPNEMDIKKNDDGSLKNIVDRQYSHIIISPGPGSPDEAGNCISVIKDCYKHTPILGICLGHQAIAESFGCIVKKHSSIVHGKTSMISHNNDSPLYKSIPKIFEATRYHSLVVDRNTICESLIVNAKLTDGTVMGIEHSVYPVYGVQYHPESIKTDYGEIIIKNFINVV